jgi:sugar lactone lactonase YvrE
MFTHRFLFEWDDGRAVPYPDLASQQDLRFVFGLTADTKGRLWLVAPATLERARTRLLAYDLQSGQRVFDLELAPGVGRFAQDLRVSPDGETVYLADTGAFRFTAPGLLVVRVADASVRAVLQGDPSVLPGPWTIRTDRGPYRIGFGLLTFSVGVDGLALSRDGEWLYYAPMSGDTLHRVRTHDLADASLAPSELSRRVEAVGKKPLSDGIELDDEGAVIFTDIENHGLARRTFDGRTETLVRVEGVTWADGVAIHERTVYFTDSAIPSYIDPLLRPPSRERIAGRAPYHLYRFELSP